MPQTVTWSSLGDAKSACFQGPKTSFVYWEVLNGVGVDGVGGLFPFFFFVFLRFSLIS